MQNTITRHYPLILATLLILGLAVAGDGTTESLRYQRDKIFSGEIYRLLTAHLVHLNWTHTLMNMAAIIIGWFLFADAMTNTQWLGSIASCAVIISLLLMIAMPGLSWYVGFSGLIHGLMLQGLILDQRIQTLTKALVITALLLKVGYELYWGGSTSTTAMIGADVIVESHLFGLIGGGFTALVIRLKRAQLEKHRRSGTA